MTFSESFESDLVQSRVVCFTPNNIVLPTESLVEFYVVAEDGNEDVLGYGNDTVFDPLNLLAAPADAVRSLGACSCIFLDADAPLDTYYAFGNVGLATNLIGRSVSESDTFFNPTGIGIANAVVDTLRFIGPRGKIIEVEATVVRLNGGSNQPMRWQAVSTRWVHPNVSDDFDITMRVLPDPDTGFTFAPRWRMRSSSVGAGESINFSAANPVTQYINGGGGIGLNLPYSGGWNNNNNNNFSAFGFAESNTLNFRLNGQAGVGKTAQIDFLTGPAAIEVDECSLLQHADIAALRLADTALDERVTVLENAVDEDITPITFKIAEVETGGLANGANGAYGTNTTPFTYTPDKDVEITVVNSAIVVNGSGFLRVGTTDTAADVFSASGNRLLPNDPVKTYTFSATAGVELFFNFTAGGGSVVSNAVMDISISCADGEVDLAQVYTQDCRDRTTVIHVADWDTTAPGVVTSGNTVVFGGAGTIGGVATYDMTVVEPSKLHTFSALFSKNAVGGEVVGLLVEVLQGGAVIASLDMPDITTATLTSQSVDFYPTGDVQVRITDTTAVGAARDARMAFAEILQTCQSFDPSELNERVTALENAVVQPPVGDSAISVKAAGSVLQTGVAQEIVNATVTKVTGVSGTYDITFLNDAPTATYPVLVTMGALPQNDDYQWAYLNRTVSGFRVEIREQDNGAAAGVLRDSDFSFQVLTLG